MHAARLSQRPNTTCTKLRYVLIALKRRGFMSRNTPASLGDHFAEFIDAQVQSGRYASASDVVRAGLRPLEPHETQMRVLQEALKAGEASGVPKPFDSEAFLVRTRVTHDGQRQAASAETAGRTRSRRHLALYPRALIARAVRTTTTVIRSGRWKRWRAGKRLAGLALFGTGISGTQRVPTSCSIAKQMTRSM